MKCFALVVALCCFGLCAGQSSSLTSDFFNDNILKPLLDSVQNNAIALLGQQLTSLLTGLFGKRALPINVAEVLQSVSQFIAQIKQVYQKVFGVFVQIVQNAGAWINKPDWARIEFVRAGIDAENIISHLNLNFDFLKPLINLVQTHLGALVTDFEGIISQVLDAAQHPLQSLIGTGSLLQP